MPDSKPPGAQPLPDPTPHAPGQTTPARGAGSTPIPKEPHERDESADSQVRPPDEVMKQAHDDIKDGLVDTSKGEATDATYARHLRSTPQDADTEPPKAPVGKSR